MCLLFDELFGSESISQVYAIILEFFATLGKQEQAKLEYLFYGEEITYFVFISKLLKNIYQLKVYTYETKYLSD